MQTYMYQPVMRQTILGWSLFSGREAFSSYTVGMLREWLYTVHPRTQYMYTGQDVVQEVRYLTCTHVFAKIDYKQ